MEKRLNGVKLKLSRTAYRLAKNEGIEFGLSLIVLALAAAWLVLSSEADLTHVVDFTVFCNNASANDGAFYKEQHCKYHRGWY